MGVEEGSLGGEKCACVGFFSSFYGVCVCGGGGVKYDTSLFKQKKSVGLYTISVNSLQLSH